MTEYEMYEEFSTKMAQRYPRYFGENKQYGGFQIGKGWYPIVETLVHHIDSYTRWQRNMRARDLRKIRAKEDVKVVAKVNWIKVIQVKEKLGSLRFYYEGGDEHIFGMVRMAEAWSEHSCETCGNLGERRSGGWVRTLCDFHENLYQTRKQND